MEANSLEKLVTNFINNKPTRIGNYFVEGNELVYKALTERELTFSRNDQVRVKQVKQIKEAIKNGIAFVDDRWSGLADIESKAGDKLSVRCLGREVIATKIKHDGKEISLGNSSLLTLANEEFVTSGNRRRRSGSIAIETDIQRELSKQIPMIPFTVFSEAGLDLSKMQIVERGKNETVTRIEKEYKEIRNKLGGTDTKIIEHEIKVHYTGATLFIVQNKTYLFDLDRRELKHGILNPFLVELMGVPKSIAEAYEGLKPSEVKQALASGLKVLRQGEWFFIPVSELEAKRLAKAKPKHITLQAGVNRPNYCEGVQMYKGRFIDDQRSLREAEDISEAKVMAASSEYFVTNKVTHSGREHKDLELKGWYRAVPNTATQSWTIRGEVD